jgi:hypothetical protein
MQDPGSKAGDKFTAFLSALDHESWIEFSAWPAAVVV